MMITYKDQAWCSQSYLCGNVKCFRNYTDEEHEKNTAGVDLPLSWSNCVTDTCGFKEKEK